ncbi:hypothetical protein MBRA1_003020 [Malassezia brasiliensis]|uniref:Rad4-domain-containing protein n=1 Tax=Malassezia brasiliensis TaxID=1821822 RepID=A0AAF0ITY2_9BASI|nr:hypothetical protein MBRA1_003020 [Malassezia brasiliensis]
MARRAAPRRAVDDVRAAHAHVTEEVHDVHAVSDSDTSEHAAGTQDASLAAPLHVDLTQLSDDDDGGGGGDAGPVHQPSTHSDSDADLEEVDCAPYAGGDSDADLDMDDVAIDPSLYASMYSAPSSDAPTDADAPHPGSGASTSHTQAAPLQVVLPGTAPNASSRKTQRRTAPLWTPRDRKNRILVHQVHVLALLAATRIRNAWCNDAEVRETLLDTVPDHLLHKLHAIHPKREPERRERVRLFEAFLHDLVRWWASRFRLHAAHSAETAWRQPSTELVVGRRVPPHTWIDGWLTETPAERDARHKQQRAAKSKQRRSAAPMEVAIFPPGTSTSTPTYLRLLPSHAPRTPADLVEATHARIGTHETSAMLFCALCRALGVPARLVVSVQVGACTAGAAKIPGASARALRTRERVVASDEETPHDADVRLHVQRRRRMSSKRDDDYYVEPLDTRAPPTVWVEVFSKPYQHWITVDPIRALVRVTGNKHMEPAPTNQQNRLVYVVGFEEDGYARDVTARYTRTLHTKVARQRPAAVGRATVPDAAQATWWASVVRALHRPQRLDRDAMEDVELADTAAREPMPTSLNAFKDHPVFCLEQFLRREQVIHPPHRVGTFQGKPVYLRANVVQLQSARQWFNQGRVVREGEQPLKTVKARTYTLQSKRLEEQARAEGLDDATEALYARAQTEVYVPPPVRDGQVPRNAFGRVDLFVPSMLPAGGTHIPHALAAKAAKGLGVSYSEAVVGFEFRKFRSVPIIQGVVVPTVHAQAVWEAIATAEQQAAATEHAKRQTRAIKGWRKLLTALTVAKHVHEQYGAGAAPPTSPTRTSAAAAAVAATAAAHVRDAAPQLRAADSPPPAAPTPPPTAPDTEADSESLWPHVPTPERPRMQGPIVSLDELMAQDAQAPTSSPPLPRAPVRHPRAPSPVSAAAQATPKRRRIVVRRSARASPPPSTNPAPHRRSQRRAAQAARAAFQTASDGSDADDAGDADAVSEEPMSDTST